MKPPSRPIDHFIHSTVRIECVDANGGISSGTGYAFIFCEEMGGIPCVVTNKHVIKGAVSGKFHLTCQNEDGTPNIGKFDSITIGDFEKYCLPHPNPNIDLAIFPLYETLLQGRKNGTEYYVAPLRRQMIANPRMLDGLSSMEEILMIGYPIGLWDEVNNLPIIRTGTTATNPKFDFKGKPEFLIDAPCFPGSSGSPVFLFNMQSYTDVDGSQAFGRRVAFLGTLYAGPTFSNKGELTINAIPAKNVDISFKQTINLGLVIQANEILVFDDLIRKMKAAG